jgi:DNA-binding response OmpR family regulator
MNKGNRFPHYLLILVKKISLQLSGIYFAVFKNMKKKILITEDDPGLQDIFKIILEKAGYDVEIISNGNPLLKDDFIIPDLFLLDKQLSGMNGIDICKHLKKQKKTRNIPVIMISANPGIGAMAQDAGANAYIEKPFEKNYLLKMVEEHI